MQKCVFVVFFLVITQLAMDAQGFNMVKKANIKIPNQLYTDIWGYESENGNKFAVVGTRQKTIIYDVTE